MQLTEYLNLKYPVSLKETEEGRFIAWHPDFGFGTMSVEEDTVEEALKELDLNRKDMIKYFWENGMEIPMPKDEDLSAYSGKFNLRISRGLHKELVVEAEKNSLSLNRYVGQLLAERNAFEKVVNLIGSITRSELGEEVRSMVENLE